jgi:HTH-type transcriptional regulator / antitoxin HipB
MMSIWSKLKNRNYRRDFTSAKVDSDLAAQIYALREQRGWTQSDLAREAEMAQPRIARLESSCDGVSTSTLKRLAAAFDVALQIRFVPFSQMASDSTQNRVDKAVPPFDSDNPLSAFNSIEFQTASNDIFSFSHVTAATSRNGLNIDIATPSLNSGKLKIYAH